MRLSCDKFFTKQTFGRRPLPVQCRFRREKGFTERMPSAESTAAVTLRSPQGRGLLLAAVLGSGMAFLDSTAVNVALPALQRSFDSDLSLLQWTIDAYLLFLGALLLVGGAL